MTLGEILKHSNWALSLLAEVESLHGKPIRLAHDPKLQGEVGADLNSAIVYYRSEVLFRKKTAFMNCSILNFPKLDVQRSYSSATTK